MGFLQDFCEIFLEKIPQKHYDITLQSLQEKYHKELKEVFFDDVFIAMDYVSIKNDLERYKFFSHRQLVSKFVDIYAKMYHCVDLRQEDFCVTVVPMHWTRYFSRWFHHMAYIATHLSKKEKIPYFPLLSTRFTSHQAKLSRADRLKNRQNVFSVKKMKKIPQNVILLDDIVTSGVTVNECARELKKAWVKRIIVFALASNF